MNLADALVPKQYSDGEQIIRQGDTADGMYFVEDGVVRITRLGEHGREIEVHLFILYINPVARKTRIQLRQRRAPRKFSLYLTQHL